MYLFLVCRTTIVRKTRNRRTCKVLSPTSQRAETKLFKYIMHNLCKFPKYSTSVLCIIIIIVIIIFLSELFFSVLKLNSGTEPIIITTTNSRFSPFAKMEYSFIERNQFFFVLAELRSLSLKMFYTMTSLKSEEC